MDPDQAAIAINDSIRLQLRVWDGTHYGISTKPIRWSASDTTVLRIGPDGFVVGMRAGIALVTAVTQGTAGYALVTVAPAILAGAGDIADCSSGGDEATADLLAAFTGTVFTLGDNVYESGTADEFARCYEPSWGRYKARTRPAPGNHDYLTPAAAPYFAYFGEAAGDPALGYYSYDLASWHIVVINTTAAVLPGSAQEQWLRADLAAHATRCTLAYWHYPRFSTGWQGNHPALRGIWQALYDAGVDVVLSGHDHHYERFRPQTPDGVADSIRGIREFVVGTGGKNLLEFHSTAPNSEVRDNSTFGILLLMLYDDRYEWRFVPTERGGFTDGGGDRCH